LSENRCQPAVGRRGEAFGWQARPARSLIFR